MLAEEWVLRGANAAHALTIDQAWANVTEEWAASGIPFDRSRGYDPEVIDVASPALIDVLNQRMDATSDDPGRLSAPATVFRVEMGNGFVEFTFACWDLLPVGW